MIHIIEQLALGLIRYLTTPIIQVLTALVAPFTLIGKTKNADKDLLNIIMRVLIGVVIAVPSLSSLHIY